MDAWLYVSTSSEKGTDSCDGIGLLAQNTVYVFRNR